MISMFHRSHNTRVTGIEGKITKSQGDSPIYILELKIQFGDWDQQTITVHGSSLESVIPKLSFCDRCHAEHEQDLVALGNSVPMANPDVDDYENLPF